MSNETLKIFANKMTVLSYQFKNSTWKLAYFKVIVALINQWNRLSLFRLTEMGFIYYFSWTIVWQPDLELKLQKINFHNFQNPPEEKCDKWRSVFCCRRKWNCRQVILPTRFAKAIFAISTNFLIVDSNTSVRIVDTINLSDDDTMNCHQRIARRRSIIYTFIPRVCRAKLENGIRITIDKVIKGSFKKTNDRIEVCTLPLVGHNAIRYESYYLFETAL